MTTYCAEMLSFHCKGSVSLQCSPLPGVHGDRPMALSHTGTSSLASLPKVIMQSEHSSSVTFCYLALITEPHRCISIHPRECRQALKEIKNIYIYKNWMVHEDTLEPVMNYHPDERPPLLKEPLFWKPPFKKKSKNHGLESLLGTTLP